MSQDSLGYVGPAALLKHTQNPVGSWRRDKASGKEYCISIWSLTLSEVQIVEVFIFSGSICVYFC